MRKSIIVALLAGVALPLGAHAQDSGTTPPAGGTTPPAASDTGTSGSGASGMSTDTGGAASGSSMGSEAPVSGSAATSSGSMGSDATTSGTASDTAMASDMAGDGDPFVTVPPSGAWRATDLDGKDVYGADGESIGEITDVLVSEDGRVMAVLVGVGGFLGIGEKDVAVSMAALEFGPGKTEGLKTEEEANAASSTASGTGSMAGGSAGGTGMAGGTAGGAEAPAASAEPEEPVVGEDNLPDRIVLNVSREQLEEAPAFGEPEEESGSADSGMTSTDPASGDASQPAVGGTAPAN
ncbi:PRC-barrel domain-containing protein [Aurantimonas sp. 22II-16-19i]|uniref:PRC-barrel domain-containing protein n=1 Tax=Aurantimonas sp. 22II-16-19i TaxID=1317114 RepID=UPI0009F7DD30|nr:PRC-barrel domain-containing protein [Aurantimonas sp. 22II-16-19i]ORE88124.1 PRC-barrel domain-containing protein [Aurantimonas sp. 22II-16-19i]